MSIFIVTLVFKTVIYLSKPLVLNSSHLDNYRDEIEHSEPNTNFIDRHLL